jgi:glycosyltransferase involved in cell wall biosynthesis
MSVVIPAFNEEANIRFVVEDCRRTLNDIPGDHEIIVVDDASTDATPRLLADLASTVDRLRVLHNPKNFGCHPSVRRGLDAARGEWALFLPADRQIRASALQRFLTQIHAADMVCSYRRRRSDPWYRVWISRFYNRIVRLAIGIPLRDFDSSILVRRAAYLEVAPDLIADSASLSVELVVRLLARGYRVAEVEIEHYPRVAGRATGLNLRDVTRVPVNLIRAVAIARRAGAARPSIRRAAL